MRTRTTKSSPASPGPRPRSQYSSNTMHWLFRSNLPHRRSSAAYSADLGRRNFFGMSELFGVLLNPSETVRSLRESRRLLEEARNEINETRECSQLRTKHAFTRLPWFLPREAEIRAIERALEGEPSFTVLFGASSVGKTALVREVLSRKIYHVLHFDLRIPGFADMTSLYMSISQQMERYFDEISKTIPGYEEFRKEGLEFKHDRLNVERRLNDSPVGSSGSQVRTSDIARLMELFQSSLLKYSEFEPPEQPLANGKRKKDSDVSSDRTKLNSSSPSPPSHKSRWFFKRKSKKPSDGQQSQELSSSLLNSNVREKEPEKVTKRIPVVFIDEAHKLPALIQSSDAMKCLLDSMLVLTKQDRLCHVIHATSDPFYQAWLRQLNVMQHCKIITVGDCTKTETRTFFVERMLPRVPENLRAGLSFDVLYDAFGGKLAHWQDYINDYGMLLLLFCLFRRNTDASFAVNAGGSFEIKQSSHFLQAHAVLNLHIIHSSQATTTISGGQDPTTPSTPAARPRSSGPDALHANLGPAGFKTYPPVRNSLRDSSGIGEDYSADFSAMQLLKVMSKLSQAGTIHLPYFLLCRELGVRAVDGMVKGRVLNLQWTDPVTREGEPPTRPEPVTPATVNPLVGAIPSPINIGSGSTLGASSEDGDMMVINPINMSTRELGQIDEEDEEEEVIGPKLMPLTPIMRYAMREVVLEYEDVRTLSDYASFTDVEEY
ncbi:uncharacterized protein EDB91DRAFT_477547 [Suillus paluster]|uniref:uncharacterized protein n=1 Tax=Suillus paluster TaxID=48578 RepID=UPI001B879EF1|nr:uncharacterized protein EDB91DRAFT_477547 [Suillus paluster]KAG1737469.1 hypothetical protein EDB91DRAFT_477547 [Suillus paluster]